MDEITTTLVAQRNDLGVEHPDYVAAATAAGRCVSHPAYEPDYCPARTW